MDATIRATRLPLLLAILFMAAVRRIRTHHEVHFCGTPEIPKYGLVNPTKERYEVNETVGFSCQEAYILQGPTIGVCLQNETWSVKSPSCDLNVVYKQQVNRTKGQISNPARYAVDGNRDTCADITSPPTASLSIFLPKVYNIKYILLDLEPGNMYNLAIMAIDGNSHQLCGQIVGEVYNKTSRVDCNKGYGIAAKELRIRNDKLNLANTVKICEVIAIADERSCGTPEVPTHMVQQWVDQAVTVQYQCAPGYRIIGEPEKSCINGVWEPPPRCLHANDVCGLPGTPSRGTVSPRNDAYAINDSITYNCAQGLTVVGAERRKCLENGTWSSQVPRCEVNLALGMSANSAAGLNKQLIVDGNVESCDKIERHFEGQKPIPAQLIIQLGKQVKVTTVKITLRVPNRNYSMDVTISTRNQPKSVQECNKFQGFSETKSLDLNCKENFGDQVIITNTDPQSTSVVLCEVEVATASNEDSLSCGEPERPLHAEAIEIDVMPQKIKYVCAKGYKLIGPERRTCQSGTWDGKLPKCEKLEIDETDGTLTDSPNEEKHRTELDKPTSITKEQTEEPPADKERDPTVVVGVMGIALGVTAASISILCAVITIIIVMRKYGKIHYLTCLWGCKA